MAQSRVEKFKEYRKNIINGDNAPLKTTIETDIKASAPVESKTLSDQEAIFLKQIYRKENAINLLYFFGVIAAIITIIVMGIILF